MVAAIRLALASAKSIGTCSPSAKPLRIGNRVAARGQRLGAGGDDRPGAAGVPDIVKDDRVAGHVECGERLEAFRHQTRSG